MTLIYLKPGRNSIRSNEIYGPYCPKKIQHAFFWVHLNRFIDMLCLTYSMSYSSSFLEVLGQRSQIFERHGAYSCEAATVDYIALLQAFHKRDITHSFTNRSQI